ncbi:uncharacterized protein LOC116395883 [Anarrhichthys ocellatus]|uniref:uncharacterized protein LOC116395883 n=1 Tax=Anarrhichthys ocellatus TaxID=433405 RepID=UPI0012EDC955|nr:uncharacterized protein LOC116395883 [Anarrhichthys ocellatus]
MAVIQLVVAIILSLIATCGKCVHVLLGDPVTFPGTENCLTGEPAKLHRVGEHSTSLVAHREQGVWSPAWDYKDRVNRGASFAFNSTVYTDKGLYVLGCGSREERTYLYVVIGFEASVNEGEPAKLMCYISGQHVDAIRWEKGQETLLELNLSSGEIQYAPGLDGKLSLSPDGKLGDYSLILNQVLSEDQGDYFCSAHANGAREQWGEPAAVKLRVISKKPDPMGTRPTRTPTKSVTKGEHMGTWAIVVITAAVVFLIGVPPSILLGWYLKSRRAPHGSGVGRYTVCGAIR